MTKFFTVLALVLLPFSIVCMEKVASEKPPRIRDGMRGMYAAEDVNADGVMLAIVRSKSDWRVAETLIEKLNTSPLNINSTVNTGFPDNPVIQTILRCAITSGDPNNQNDVNVVKLILEKGASLKQQPHQGWNPYLVDAVTQASNAKGNLNIVKLLIAHKADVNYCFTNEKGKGYTALHEAARCNSLECIDYLLGVGANVNIDNASGHTPLAMWLDSILSSFLNSQQPQKDKYKPILEKFIERGADTTKAYFHPFTKNVDGPIYATLKPLFPNLDTIINNVKFKKIQRENNEYVLTTFKAAAQNNLHANRLITIQTRNFSLNESIVAARCLTLCYHLNPDYKQEKYEKIFSTIPLIGNIQINNQPSLIKVHQELPDID